MEANEIRSLDFCFVFFYDSLRDSLFFFVLDVFGFLGFVPCFVAIFPGVPRYLYTLQWLAKLTFSDSFWLLVMSQENKIKPTRRITLILLARQT